jgi:hypothetical protein
VSDQEECFITLAPGFLIRGHPATPVGSERRINRLIPKPSDYSDMYPELKILLLNKNKRETSAFDVTYNIVVIYDERSY